MDRDWAKMIYSEAKGRVAEATGSSTGTTGMGITDESITYN